MAMPSVNNRRPAVRTARPDDYDGIAAVVDEWFGRTILPSLPRLFLDHFWSTSRVAEDAEGLAGLHVGFVSPSQPNIAYVHVVCVRPDLRRTGLGCRLYTLFFTLAAALGCREARAITSPDNYVSIDFHRSLGFTVGPPVDNYDGAGRARIVFTRPLSFPPPANC
jgi:ribosomal protein S18 acetylase RimI-like enzyme